MPKVSKIILEGYFSEGRFLGTKKGSVPLGRDIGFWRICSVMEDYCIWGQNKTGQNLVDHHAE